MKLRCGSTGSIGRVERLGGCSQNPVINIAINLRYNHYQMRRSGAAAELKKSFGGGKAIPAIRADRGVEFICFQAARRKELR